MTDARSWLRKPGTPHAPLPCRRDWAAPSGGKTTTVIEALPRMLWCPICQTKRAARADGLLGWHQVRTPGGLFECSGYHAPGLAAKPPPLKKGT